MLESFLRLSRQCSCTLLVLQHFVIYRFLVYSYFISCSVLFVSCICEFYIECTNIQKSLQKETQQWSLIQRSTAIFAPLYQEKSFLLGF